MQSLAQSSADEEKGSVQADPAGGKRAGAHDSNESPRVSPPRPGPMAALCDIDHRREIP